MTVYPLLVLIIRTQVFELLYHDAFPGLCSYGGRFVSQLTRLI